MIRKQLLCSSVVLILFVVSKLYSYDSVNRNITQKREVAVTAKHHAREDIICVEEDEHTHYVASLSFADEDLPPGDKQVQNRMMHYLKNYSYSKQRTYRLHRHAAQSLPKVAAILRQHGIPQDFKYIPLVESGFKSSTFSSRGASGYWQFMPATARAFGLRVDNEVDERQDIEKSTRAAAKYIKVLYREFGSWTLVAAAYNIGEGKLQRAINKQQEDNYFKLNLNKETGSYVYKLISVKEIIENPALHGYSRGRAILANAESEEEGNPRKL